MVEKIRKVIKVSENNHIFIRLFIQINKNTLDIIKDFFKTKSSVKTVGNCENKKLTDDLEIVKGSTENLKNFLINYRDKIDLKLREKFNIYSLNKYTNLIKLFYYLYIEDIDKELSEEIEGYYSPNGVKLEAPIKGLNIVKYKNGTSKKIYKK